MKLGKMTTGNANFSFDYFQNGGHIAFDCITCSTKNILNIEIYKTGKLVEQISDDFESSILQELIEKKIVNLKSEKYSWHLSLSKYVLWNLNALYSIPVCEKCNAEYVSIFGMGELQPGREEVQFKGVWQILYR